VSTPVVQIYTIQSVAEASALAAMGIDRIGVTPADRGLPGEISVGLAAEICEAIRGRATVSALSVDTDLDAITAMVEEVRPHVLHLCGPSGAVSPDEVTTLRGRLPGIEMMQAVAVVGEASIADGLAYAAVADCLILDSVTAEIEGVGASGVVHDWTVSRRIVDVVDVPVILAGGLSSQNVGEAIRAVRPWGVDSLTHTNRMLPDGGFRKDLELVREFAEVARGEAA